MNIITIDGGAATGKSTISEKLAKRINYLSINSGLIYRQITYFLLQNNFKKWKETKKISSDEKNNLDLLKSFLETLKVEELKEALEGFKKKYFKDEEFVNDDILINLFSSNKKELFSEKISFASSYFSTYFLFIREFVNEILIKIAKNNKNVIFEGRDMGTVVFPNAKLKFFLKVKPEVAAKRRQQQIENENYEEILKKIKDRNKQDQERKIAPLVPAKDAIVIDTGKYQNSDDVTEEIIKFIKSKIDL